MRRTTAIALAVLLAIFVSGCATSPLAGLSAAWQTPGIPVERPELPPGVRAIQQKLIEGARLVVDLQDLTINGRTFPWDCTGTVRAIYWNAGIDLAVDFGRYAGNGVSRLFRTLEARRLLYASDAPVAGDIVFWDNTWDQNGDGLWNDPLTHVGMVLETSREGAISYVHLHYSRGVVIESMNLREPDVYQRLEGGSMRIVNAPMRLATPGKPHPERWLAGQLFRVLGMGYLLAAS